MKIGVKFFNSNEFTLKTFSKPVGAMTNIKFIKFFDNNVTINMDKFKNSNEYEQIQSLISNIEIHDEDIIYKARKHKNR